MGKLVNYYACPYCGCKGQTTVLRTINHRDCIIRTRKCEVCGMSHTTVEVSFNIADSVKAADLGLFHRPHQEDEPQAVVS